jgi:hypothetical protein
MAGNGDDFRFGKGRHLAKAGDELTAVHVRHCQIEQHQMGLKGGRHLQCLHPAIGHMHLVAEFLQQQTKCVRTVPVVIDHQNSKHLLFRRHRFSFFASLIVKSPSPRRLPRSLAPFGNRQA